MPNLPAMIAVFLRNPRVYDFCASRREGPAICDTPLPMKPAVAPRGERAGSGRDRCRSEQLPAQLFKVSGKNTSERPLGLPVFQNDRRDGRQPQLTDSFRCHLPSSELRETKPPSPFPILQPFRALISVIVF